MTTQEPPALTSFERRLLAVLTRTPVRAVLIIENAGVADYQALLALRALEGKHLAWRQEIGLRYAVTELGARVAELLWETENHTKRRRIMDALAQRMLCSIDADKPATLAEIAESLDVPQADVRDAMRDLVDRSLCSATSDEIPRYAPTGGGALLVEAIQRETETGTADRFGNSPANNLDV